MIWLYQSGLSELVRGLDFANLKKENVSGHALSRVNKEKILTILAIYFLSFFLSSLPPISYDPSTFYVRATMLSFIEFFSLRLDIACHNVARQSKDVIKETPPPLKLYQRHRRRERTIFVRVRV